MKCDKICDLVLLKNWEFCTFSLGNFLYKIAKKKGSCRKFWDILEYLRTESAKRRLDAVKKEKTEDWVEVSLLSFRDILRKFSF